ncbi:Sodium/hydrogen exchanger family-domain-containing protein [Kalaharituber pfeilii]|nr:Sodium/hydrogen exchanger family-domain-containing protein [Kalaharituber pfeilii]
MESLSLSRRAAPSQAGILEGMNPSEYNAKNPLTLFIIQMTIIIVTCRLLHWPLSKLRQPRVIAEVIGVSCWVGPTVMGRIPNFNESIFPAQSKPLLSVVANLGLVLFLFLVGLEVDIRMLIANLRIALSVGAAGMMLPFGLGAAISYGLYNQFSGDPGTKDVGFGVFVLFIGVAMAITAFPVLARILTELKLLQSSVGTIVLSAGVGNDVVGWILLALTVALVNAGTGLTALYVLLIAVGWTLFLIYVVRPGLLWMLNRSGSLENGPTQAMVALTLFLVLASAFFTDIIGVHAIFGGFLVGLICPHEGGFAIRLTEKIEDLVSVLFLPLYFALSGLNTDIGLLNGGLVWGYVIGVIAIAFFGKIAGGTLAARVNGLVWRESFTIGVLMSCKGLVELIVLNIGLQAGIISQRVFTIFVVMALVTTFATTPLVEWLYPPWYQKKLAAWKRGEIDWDGNRLIDDEDSLNRLAKEKSEIFRINKMTMLLRLESLPGLFTFINLLGGDYQAPRPKVHKTKQRQMANIEEETSESSQAITKEASHKRPLEVDGLRILELTQRTSTVMKVSEVDEFTDRDPVLNVFRTFGRLNHLAVSAGISVAPESSFAEVLVSRAADRSSELLLVPWSETGAVTDPQDTQMASTENRFTSSVHNQFISKVLNMSSCNTAILVDRGFGGMEKNLTRTSSLHSLRSRRNVNLDSPQAPVADPSHHIFFPYFGGEDDKLALWFVLQLTGNPNVTATIVHVVYKKDATTKVPELTAPSAARTASSARRDLPRGLSSSNIPTVSKDESGNIPSESTSAEDPFFNSFANTLPPAIADRVLCETVETNQVLRYTLVRACEELGASRKNAGDLLVIGRGAKEARAHIRQELVGVLSALEHPVGAGTELRKCLGDVAEAAIVANVKASVLVVQAGLGASATAGPKAADQGLEVTRVPSVEMDE